MASKHIEDTYPLSPTQQGMLFHALYAPHSGVYVEQLRCMLRGDLDAAAFERAWQQVVDRHPALRSAFAWKRLARPLQVVGRRVTVPLRRLDWRELAPAEQQMRLEAYCEEDRRQGFELSRAPLLRVVLIQLADDAFHFVWTVHHLLLDGWSTALVLKEVFALYAAQRRGEALQLETARPYRDYIAWLQRQNLAAAEAFWRRTLSGFTTATPLGVDRPAAALRDEPSLTAKQYLELAAEETARLLALARQRTLTLNTLILGAWALLLSRYSGAEDLVFGATVSGRPPELPGVQSIVGLFITTVPVRVYVPPALPLLAWLQQLQDQQAEARQYAHSPLIEIQGWSAVPRGHPLFESIVVFENYPAATALAAGAQVDLAITDVGSADQTNYPLTVGVLPGETMTVEIGYDCQRFDDAAITRMLGHLRTLFQGMVEQPARRLRDMPLLTETERRQLLVEWNSLGDRGEGTGNREQEPSTLICVHHLFEAQAAYTPDAVAIVLDGLTNDGRGRGGACPVSTAQHLTYGELNRRANQLAYHLQALGVGPEVRVGLCVERSLEMLIGLWGILKAGGAYVPLDPAYPPERLAFMLEDAQPVVLITTTNDEGRKTNDEGRKTKERTTADCRLPTDKTGQAVSLSACQLVNLETDWPLIAAQPAHNLESSSAPDNLAYVLYTSGSTGRPKGVLVSHTNLAHAYTAWLHAYALHVQPDRHLQMANVTFDVFSGDLVRALCTGGTLVLCPRALLAQPAKLYALLDREQISCAEFVPAVLRLLSAQLAAPAPALQRMRLLAVGSDSWYVRDHAALRRLCGPNPRLVNSYGVTEATIDSSYFAGTLVDDAGDNLVPIGRPFASTQLYVLDAQLNPAPIGVVGELYIGGMGVARGYLGRPDLTAERFIPNPFANCRLQIADCRLEDPAICNLQSAICNRLYRTGDLARYLPDGQIAYLGRADQQVKLRGFRIELGEIEAVVAQHPAVREAVVIAREDQPGSARLVAYVVEGPGVRGQGAGERRTTNDERRTTNDERRTTIDDKSDAEPSSIVYRLSSHASELRAFLAERLPDYMIPSAFVLLDGLPLTPNGKVDRAVLPAPDPIRPELEYTFVAPRTRVEEAIAHTWAQVLGIGRVGANDNFFALGGHSLLAAYVIDQINETFLMELPLRHLFEAPTVAGLAQVVEQTKAAEADSTMAQLLATIEQLSADEVQALLAGEHTQGE